MSKKTNPMIYEINRVAVPKDVPKINTDASYKNGVGSYCFMIRSEEGIYIESASVPEEWLEEHSRSCELYGVIRALTYCMDHKFIQVGLFFDYIGIYNLMIARPTDPAIYRRYADIMKGFTSNMDIYFHKVDGPDDYHELVDLVSRSNVKLRLGGNEIGKYKQLIQQGKAANGK